MRTELPHELPARTLVLAVRPEVDGGRYPVKRVVGEPVEVEADVVGDGHDVAARRAAPSRPRRASSGTRSSSHRRRQRHLARRASTPTALGRHHYTVIAWVDAFATWRHGLERKARRRRRRPRRAARGRAARRCSAGARALANGGCAAMRRSPERDRGRHAPSRARGQAMARSRPDRCARDPLPPRARGHRRAPARALLGLVRAVPALDRRRRHARHVRDAEGCLDYVAELGFDVLYLPPIHPIGRAFRKGPNNTPTAGAGRPGQPVGDRRPRRAATRRSIPSSARSPTSTDFVARRAGARHRGRARHRVPVLARPPVGHASTPSGSGTGPTARSSTPRTRRRSTRTSTRSTSRATDWRALWEALRDVFLLLDRARRPRLPRRQPAHQAVRRSGSGASREVKRDHPDAIFLAEAFTRPKVMYRLAKVGFIQSYTYFTWRNDASTSSTSTSTELTHGRRSRVLPARTSGRTRPTSCPSTCSTAAAPRSSRGSCSRRRCRRSYGIYGPAFELWSTRRAARRRGVPRLGEVPGPRTGTSTRRTACAPLIARVNRDPPRATRRCSDNAALRFHADRQRQLLCYSQARRRRRRRRPRASSTSTRTTRRRAGSTSTSTRSGIDPATSRSRSHDLLGGARYRWQRRAQLRRARSRTQCRRTSSRVRRARAQRARRSSTSYDATRSARRRSRRRSALVQGRGHLRAARPRLPRQQRRRHRRLPRADRAARLPARPRRHRALAAAVLPVAAARRRLRHRRLHATSTRPTARCDDFKRFLARGAPRAACASSPSWCSTTRRTSTRGSSARAARRRAAAERDFYVWSDTPDTYTDARIIFKDFETSNWTWDPVAERVLLAPLLLPPARPELRQPAVREALLDVARLLARAWASTACASTPCPYLFEREGTNCENLPETHEFLKELRAHIDEQVPATACCSPRPTSGPRTPSPTSATATSATWPSTSR